MSSSRKRTARRAADKAAAEGARQRERLALLEPGGGPDHPIELATASLVEARVASLGCSACGGELRVESHEARVIDGRRLRVAEARCARCGAGRVVFLRVGSALPN